MSQKNGLDRRAFLKSAGATAVLGAVAIEEGAYTGALHGVLLTHQRMGD